MIIVKRFTASWCAPCRMLAPVLSGLAEQYPDVLFQVVDIDTDPDAADFYDIRNVPTVLIIKDDTIVENIVGANPKQLYIQALNKHINS